MTDTSSITPEEISKLSIGSFFESLDWYGVTIPLQILDLYLSSASARVRKTRQFEFFEGFFWGQQMNENWEKVENINAVFDS